MHTLRQFPWVLAVLGGVSGCEHADSPLPDTFEARPGDASVRQLKDATLSPETEPGQARPAGSLSRGFFVSGGRLYDAGGHDFVLRGVNHPLAWFPGEALGWLEQVALTGANAVRLVWDTRSS